MRFFGFATIVIESEGVGGTSVAFGDEEVTRRKAAVSKAVALTFDAEGEIIIALRGLQRYPRGGLILFSPLRIYSSFIIGSCLLRIRNS